MKKIENIREIQALEYNILCRTVDFFETYGISYILSGGTMLGSVRHKGFIPWDDDIDIRIPREDYERFKKLVREGKFNAEHMEVKIPGDKGYRYPFIKVMDSRTEVREGPAQTASKVWIDVFPLDHYPDSKIGHFLSFWNVKLHDFVLTGRIIFGSKNHPLYKRVLSTILTAYCELVGGPEKFAARLDRRSVRMNEKYKHSKHCGDGTWPVGMQDYFETDCIFPTIPSRFEQRDFMIPVRYDKYLTCFYGNYMQLPPEEKRQVQHELQAWWNSETDLNEVIRDFMQA